MRISGLLLDVLHRSDERGSYAELYLKTEEGIVRVKDRRIRPFFFVIPKEGKEDELAEIIKGFGGEVELSEMKLLGEKLKVIRVSCKSTSEMMRLREQIKEHDYCTETLEHRIAYVTKYLFSSDLKPMCFLELEVENGEVKEVIGQKEGKVSLKMAAIDIEVDNPYGKPREEKDQIIMASYYDGTKSLVLSLKPIDAPFVEVVKSESELIKRLIDLITKNGVDLILTYNGDQFDLPYLRERARRRGLKFGIGIGGEEPKKVRRGGQYAMRVPGRAHIDVFQIANFLAKVGALRLPKYTLEDVYFAILGKEKIEIEKLSIHGMWKKEEHLEKFALYNLQDAIACYELAQALLPMEIELSRLVGLPLFDVTRMTPGQLVEALIMRNVHSFNELIPKKPEEEEVKRRFAITYEGALVIEPTPGMHENIAVLDFTSLYPTIIITFNICPSTLNKVCDQYNIAPSGAKFCKEPKGFIPQILESLYRERLKLKRELKKLKEEGKEGSEEYKLLDAKQKAMKVLINAFYGSLGYPRFRWYSLDCAKAITAWGREYISKVIDMAKEEGFEVIYGDTDSLFIKFGGIRRE